MIQELVLLGMATGLVAYNNLVNLWPPYKDHHVYIAGNLTMTAALLMIAAAVFDIAPRDAGLFLDLSGATFGIAGGLIASLPILLVARLWPRWIADRRLAGADADDIRLRTLLRVPFGTALLEEVAFRGVLLSALLPYGVSTAIFVSSLVFGSWHILPSLELIRANRPNAGWVFRVTGVVAGVVLTTTAGLFFAWLRLATGGLAAPLLFHASLNSAATVWSYLASKRLVPA